MIDMVLQIDPQKMLLSLFSMNGFVFSHHKAITLESEVVSSIPILMMHSEKLSYSKKRQVFNLLSLPGQSFS